MGVTAAFDNPAAQPYRAAGRLRATWQLAKKIQRASYQAMASGTA